MDGAGKASPTFAARLGTLAVSPSQAMCPPYCNAVPACCSGAYRTLGFDNPGQPPPPPAEPVEGDQPWIVTNRGRVFVPMFCLSLCILLALVMIFRRRDRRILAGAPSGLRGNGATNADIEAQRTERLNVVLKELPIVPPDEAGQAANECPICLSAFSEDERPAARLPCNHMVHHACIARWLVDGRGSSCPLCKSALLDEENGNVPPTRPTIMLPLEVSTPLESLVSSNLALHANSNLSGFWSGPSLTLRS